MMCATRCAPQRPTLAKGWHIIRSDDGRCALGVGAVDDPWQFGKARGIGGPWKHSEVKANQPSDAHLMASHDQKSVTLSHTPAGLVKMRIEVDISGTDHWVTYHDFDVAAGKPLEHRFPDAFGAYWVRVVADKDTKASAQFTYK